MKLMLYIGAGAGGLIGAYVPILLLHVDGFSAWSITGGFIGTLVGLWAGYKISQAYGE